MNPKPLTKKLAQEIFNILKEPEDNIAKHLKIALFVKHEIIKPRVNWLLKEIEKDNKNMEKEKEVGHKERRAYFRGWCDAQKWCIDLIKKAFEGVVRE